MSSEYSQFTVSLSCQAGPRDRERDSRSYLDAGEALALSGIRQGDLSSRTGALSPQPTSGPAA